MTHLADRHIAQIEKQNDHDLQKAFLTLCEEEVKLENRLEAVREIKSRILIEIEIRNHRKK